MFHKKEERLKSKTMKFVASIIINTRERLIKRHEMIKNDLELSFEKRRMISSFHDDIKLAIRVINGLPILDESFLDSGLIPEDPLNSYAYKSILWDRQMNSELITSNIYKGRFIMNMLVSIDQNFETILSKEVEFRGDKKNDTECINLIYQIRDCIGNFIIKLSEGDDYRDELLKVHELIVMADENNFEKSKKLLKVASREINRLDDMMNPGFLDGKKPSDDITIQNVCLLAYIMATGTSNTKNTFMVPEEVTLKDTEAIKVIVEVLGNCILKRRGYNKPYPEIYRWFLHSLPKISYRFKDINYNRALAEGCRALSFISFYSGSKSIKKLISKMIY